MIKCIGLSVSRGESKLHTSQSKVQCNRVSSYHQEETGTASADSKQIV